MLKSMVLAAFVVLTLGVPGHASVSGSQGFSAPSLTQADASPTGNIITSTMFDLAGFSTTSNSTGMFSGLPIQNFGHVILTLGPAAKFDFGDATFGTFSSSTVTKVSSMPGFLDILIQGTFKPGTFEPSSSEAMAQVRVALTQTPVDTGEISASGTMSITPVSEPPTALLFCTALLAAFLIVPRLRGRLV